MLLCKLIGQTVLGSSFNLVEGLFEGLGENLDVDTSWSQEWPYFTREFGLPAEHGAWVSSI